MHTRRVLTLMLALATLAWHPARGGLEPDLNTLIADSLAAMNRSQWDEALRLLTKATDRFGRIHRVQFNPREGVLWYRRGICELRLDKFSEAMKSFEICYRNFPNQGNNAGGINQHHKMALLKWGEAAQGAEDWQQAIHLYRLFLKERDENQDKFPQGVFHVNMAICHLKLGRIPQGIDELEIAIKNKEVFPTRDTDIFTGFLELAAACIGKGDEQALLDFTEKHRADILIEPFEMPPHAKRLMKLAGDAVEVGMDRVAMSLYQLVPASEVVRQDLQARLDALGGHPGVHDGECEIDAKDLREQIGEIDRSIREGTADEATALAAVAWLHEKHGSIRTAYAAYEQLELHWSENNKRRETNLYNLVRTCSLVGEVLAAEKYGSRFLKLFPGSKYVPAVLRMMLTDLFYEGEYEKCIEVASVMIDKLPKGSKEHDVCLHVLGGSCYYTGAYDKAQPLLDQHVEFYPKSQFEQAALYFQASNNLRLQFWSKAAKQLDVFLAKYPDPARNVFFPFSLFDRANCHYEDDEMDAALEMLDRIEKNFPHAEVMDMAFNLKGNVLQADNKLDEAEAYYKRALELAERRENRAVAGEALNYLVALLGEKPAGKEENPRLKDAVAYADKFWKEYSESPYKTQVAVAQVHALDSVGRGEEGLGRLRDVIADLAADPDLPGLEEAINSYAEIYLEKHTPEELREHFLAFPKIHAANKTARALLCLAYIDAFQNAGKEHDVGLLLQEMPRNFAPKDLSNNALVRLGDHLRTRAANPRQALPYYDEVLGRKDQTYRFRALLGRADIHSAGSGEELAKAEADLKLVFTGSQDKGERERALYRMIQVGIARTDFAGAETNAKLYLDTAHNHFTKWMPEVSLLLAEAYDKRGMVNDALANYFKVLDTHPGQVSVSAPAMKRWMELSWERNLANVGDGKGDRQSAYEGGWRYIDLTKRFFDKMTKPEQETWKEIEKLVLDYGARAEINPMK